MDPANQANAMYVGSGPSEEHFEDNIRTGADETHPEFQGSDPGFPELELADKIERSFDKLADILEGVVELDYTVKSKQLDSPQFKRVDEQLTQYMIELDTVESHGVDEVRQYRKDIVLKDNNVSLQAQGVGNVLDHIRDNGYPPIQPYTPQPEKPLSKR
eukprot:sb/3472936/